MGISIHYKGTLKSPELIAPICEELVDIAKDMEWSYQWLDEDLDKPNTAHLAEAGVISGHAPLKGVDITMHPDAEPLSLLFDKAGNLRSIVMMALMNESDFEDPFISVKTQFAPIETHITMVKLLMYLKDKYFNHLKVIDEGQYWETQDRELLKQKRDFLNEKMNEVGELLENMDSKPKESADSLAKRFEEYLKRRYGDKG